MLVPATGYICLANILSYEPALLSYAMGANDRFKGSLRSSLGTIAEDELVSFSLVLGTAERTHDLGRHLASLDAQTYRNFELIIVDQNKDERLAPILAPYVDKFPIFHLRSEPGLARAKNLGLEYVTGDIIGFPDDDCQFPQDLLHRVAQFFSDHPQADGLTGRSADDDQDSNGRFDREAGVVDKFNVWCRSTAYTIFVRRDAARGVWYDEQMGPGAGTSWGAGDDHDYLLKLLSRGALIFYDPEVCILHPVPVKVFDAAAVHRAYTYNCGAGRAIRRHNFPWRSETQFPLAVQGVVARQTFGRIGAAFPPYQGPPWRYIPLEGVRGQMEGFAW